MAIGIGFICADTRRLFASVFMRSEFWRQFFPGLYYAGIVIPGLEMGWKAGLAAGVVSGIFQRCNRRPVLGRARRRARTFDAPGGIRVLAARRTVPQRGGKITGDQSGQMKRPISSTLFLYNGQYT
jgi:hypothetical protein